MDRTALMIEADKRGLLPPDQKAALDEAIKRGLVDKPAAVSVGDTLQEIPRQVGLAARYGMEGLGDVAGIVTEPIRAVTNPILTAVGLPRAGSARDAASSVADFVGLPKPQGANERVVGDITRMMAGAGGMAGAAQKAAQVVSNPIAQRVASSLGDNVGQQVISAAGAAGAGGSVREAGGGPLAQFGASLAGGLTAAGLSSLAVKAYESINGAIKSFLTPKSSGPEVTIVLNQILKENGIDVSQIPGAVRTQLASEVRNALDTGKPVNPDVVRRIADYGVVGATPTRGTVTLDPVQITQEKNLAKLGANSTDPKLKQLAQLQNANNQKFIEFLNQRGANTANADPVVAGGKVTESILGRDAAAKVVEKSLYDKAKDSTGRALDLDREGFISEAYNRLGESNKGAFLPEGIKSILEQIRVGKAKLLDGTEIDTPFNVDVIDNLKTMLSKASRSTQDGNAKAAIAEVRNALENAQPRAMGRPVGGNQVVDPALLSQAQGAADNSATAAMKAFDEARAFARNRRNWQESAPAIQAALDDIPPDRFIKDYIIGGSNKASVRDVKALIDDMHGDPAATQAIKENVAAYLKKKALSGAKDEVGNFSQSGYNSALDAIGDLKLRLLFSAEELSALKALGRVASYEMVQPKGSAVNNSNTASAFAGLLDRIASSPIVSRIPFGKQIAIEPAQAWSAQIGSKNALAPYAAVSAGGKTARPEIMNKLLGPGLLLAAPRADSGNDKRRR